MSTHNIYFHGEIKKIPGYFSHLEHWINGLSKRLLCHERRLIFEMRLNGEKFILSGQYRTDNEEPVTIDIMINPATSLFVWCSMSSYRCTTKFNFYHSEWMGKFSRWQIGYIFIFFFPAKIGFDISCKLYDMSNPIRKIFQNVFCWKFSSYPEC